MSRGQDKVSPADYEERTVVLLMRIVDKGSALGQLALDQLFLTSVGIWKRFSALAR